jgi:hypothetical protein
MDEADAVVVVEGGEPMGIRHSLEPAPGSDVPDRTPPAIRP